MSGLTIAERLAAWARAAQVPDEVADAARTHILDCLGVALGAARLDFADGLVAAAHDLDPTSGRATVIGRRERLPVRDAALLNGALVHGLDYDDTYMPGTIHPSAAVFAACLAVGEVTRASGRDLLEAYALGVEVACVLAEAVPPGELVHRGFHPTGVLGAFAATVAVARLIDAPTSLAALAQGVVGSMAAGSMEFIRTGASVKRIHPGWAAACAITAVSLARHGVTGPAEVYEGRFGFFATHLPEDDAPEPNLDHAVETLGAPWRLPSVAIKPFPACHYIHALADAALALRRHHRVRPVDIRAITCALHSGQFALVVEPLDAKRSPSSAYAAQFSAPYVVAAALVRKQFSAAELAPDALADPEIARLASLINFAHDDRSRFPEYFSGAVRIETHHGRVLDHRIDFNRGSDRAPMSPSEVEDKFRSNATSTFSTSETQAVISLVAQIEELAEVADLTVALRSGPYEPSAQPSR